MQGQGPGTESRAHTAREPRRAGSEMHVAPPARRQEGGTPKPEHPRLRASQKSTGNAVNNQTTIRRVWC